MNKFSRLAVATVVVGFAASLAVAVPATAGNPCAAQIQNYFVQNYVKMKDPSIGCDHLKVRMEYGPSGGQTYYSVQSKSNLVAGVTYNTTATTILRRTEACSGSGCRPSSGWISTSLWYTFG